MIINHYTIMYGNSSQLFFTKIRIAIKICFSVTKRSLTELQHATKMKTKMFRVEEHEGLPYLSYLDTMID